MPRIAVIAVHGVADQAPNETARAVASLLLSSGADRRPFGPVPPGPVGSGTPPIKPDRDKEHPSSKYSAFTETPLFVPVSPVRLERTQTAAPEQPAASGWKQAARAGLYSSYGAKHLNREIRGDAREQIDFKFAYNQLEDYKASDDSPSYETVQLSGERKEHAAGELTAQIDVYEMYWADLSRLGKGLLRILGESYQLLFHLSSLGKTTVDLARIARGGKGMFPWLMFFQSVSSWLLVLPIAILNLYLLLIAAGLVLIKIPETYRLAALVAAVGTLGALAAGLLVFRLWRLGFWLWSLDQAVGLIYGALLAYYLFAHSEPGSYPALTLIWLLIAMAAVGAIAARYELRRKGARKVAMVCGAVILAVAYAFSLKAHDTPAGVIAIVGGTSEVVFAVLVVLWAALIVSHLVTWLLGEIAIWQTPGDGKRRGNMQDPKWQIERAVWTGRMGMFLPTSLFLILTLSLWMAAVYALKGSFEGLTYEPFFNFFRTKNVGVAGFMEFLVDRSAGGSFDLFLGFTALALVMVIWGFFPAVLAEAAPPEDPLGPSSRQIGHWLDHGFVLARWAGRVALFAAFVVLPGGLALLALVAGAREMFGSDTTLKLIGSILAGSAVGIVGLGSQLGKVFLGFRAGLDVALDVDNWLRETPREANVRSRICARYVSLLRHVCGLRDRQNGPYDALVIVAHSQGTVITADLLRFLAQSPDPELERLGRELPVYLLTMGCPLRQLYGLRFPHLYQWATHVGGTGSPPAQSPYQDGLIPQDQSPDPRELRVELWINAFRSGDYVGRHLWLRDDYEDRWRPAMPDSYFVANDRSGTGKGVADLRRIELCIGAGAHTHYFDETADRIAQIIDQLIGVAITGKDRYPWRFPLLRPGS